MKTIFHLHGVIWLGVVEQVCYGKINIMEGLTLLSLSGWDRCVYYWTGYITQTQRHAGNLHTFKARLYTVCKHAHAYGTHKDGIHEQQQGYHVHTVNLCQPYRPARTVSSICVHVCVRVCMCVCVKASTLWMNALMTRDLMQVFWLLPHSNWHVISYTGMENHQTMGGRGGPFPFVFFWLIFL